MSVAHRPKQATYDELLALPEHLVGELVDGELIASPRPAPAHARAASGIGASLFAPFDRKPGDPGGPGGWWILDEPELHLGPHVLVPDLAGWRRERMPHLPSTAFFELAPDWVCEVVSPSSARLDRGRKLDLYAEVGVLHAWLVDPLARLLEVLRLEGARWSRLGTFEGDAVARVQPFDAVSLELARWWVEPEASPS